MSPGGQVKDKNYQLTQRDSGTNLHVKNELPTEMKRKKEKKGVQGHGLIIIILIVKIIHKPILLKL